MEEERSLWVGEAWEGTVGLQEEAEPVCSGRGVNGVRPWIRNGRDGENNWNARPPPPYRNAGQRLGIGIEIGFSMVEGVRGGGRGSEKTNDRNWADGSDNTDRWIASDQGDERQLLWSR